MNRPKSSIRFRRTVVAGIAAAAPLALAQAAHAGPAVPAAIAVPAGHQEFLAGHAVGVQIYSCAATGWTFVAPRANLYDKRGKLLTTHFAGPTWQAKDGSKVVGRRVDGVNVDPDRHRLAAAVRRLDGERPGRRPPRAHDVHPADQHHRRPCSRRRGLQREHGRRHGRGPVHRRLPLLQGALPARATALGAPPARRRCHLDAGMPPVLS